MREPHDHWQPTIQLLWVLQIQRLQRCSLSHNDPPSAGETAHGQNCWSVVVRQIDVSSAEAIGCLESADFSPNSAVVGLRMRPAQWCSIAPVYAICVNKTQIDNVAARPCRRLALAIDLRVTLLTGTANDQFRSALGREVNRGLCR